MSRPVGTRHAGRDCRNNSAIVLQSGARSPHESFPLCRSAAESEAACASPPVSTRGAKAECADRRLAIVPLPTQGSPPSCRPGSLAPRRSIHSVHLRSRHRWPRRRMAGSDHGVCHAPLPDFVQHPRRDRHLDEVRVVVDGRENSPQTLPCAAVRALSPSEHAVFPWPKTAPVGNRSVLEVFALNRRRQTIPRRPARRRPGRADKRGRRGPRRGGGGRRSRARPRRARGEPRGAPP